MNISTPVPTANPVDPLPVSSRRRGAPKGNTNARVHGYYSRKTIAACRRELAASTPYRDIDLDIILALWQAARLLALEPGSAGLQNEALCRVFTLVRRKYGLRTRNDNNTMYSLFLRLVFDLILQPDLLVKLEKARESA